MGLKDPTLGRNRACNIQEEVNSFEAFIGETPAFYDLMTPTPLLHPKPKPQSPCS